VLVSAAYIRARWSGYMADAQGRIEPLAGADPLRTCRGRQGKGVWDAIEADSLIGLALGTIRI